MTATATDFRTLTGSYTIDPAHSQFGFVARHAMVTKVRGAFNEFEGKAVLDGENPANSSVEVTLATASIDTRNAQRDGHLRTNDFLDAERYPAIVMAAAALARSFLIDGEVVVADAQGVASFDLLRGRAREAQAFIWAFDLLELASEHASAERTVDVA